MDVLKKTSCSTVFHTVSPVHGLEDAIYYRINVQGTRTILSTSQAAGVKSLVFTSSTGVVWHGNNIRGGNEEETPIPEIGIDAYTHTKAIAEKMVLKANGQSGMKTAAMRPCGMIGPRDRQAMWRIADAYNKGQHTVQMGNNTNLVDVAYAGNVADAHLLAADGLASDSGRIAGEAFFVTNGTPVPYWNFPRMVWKELGDDGRKKITVLPKFICLLIAFIMELWCAIVGGKPPFRTFDVKFTTCEQWYNIGKAQKLLGYEPRLSLEEACRMTVKWWNEHGAREHAEMMERKKGK